MLCSYKYTLVFTNLNEKDIVLEEESAIDKDRFR